ncbi:hypothetical protein, partial [Xanthomonas arboricola]|uniref:hypothetical protein n=1 Tax=Xanthomonas arboricola TaxID=56448 RepID=UPI001955905C
GGQGPVVMVGVHGNSSSRGLWIRHSGGSMVLVIWPTWSEFQKFPSKAGRKLLGFAPTAK